MTAALKTYELLLASPIATSFRATKAANSLDIDASKKAKHHFKIAADLETPYNVGLVVGASGSGKTTLTKKIWGEERFKEILDPSRPVIDQFPERFTYDECAAMLSGVGLTAVVCWIRPANTLSNGQRARAECALQMAREVEDGVVVIDEWTSVVDRTVAKVMSHCVSKHARKTGKRIVLLSCHYDVLEWLNPDWIIDCNRQEFTDRRELCRSFQRSERLQFDVRQIDRSSWRYFSKYHYLSENMPGGHTWTFGLFHDAAQIGFQCYANYVPHRNKDTPMQVHMNRLVVHPDYAGLGLGIMFTNECAEIMAQRGFDVRCKFSSIPVYRAMSRDPGWRCLDISRKTYVERGATMGRGQGGKKAGFRIDVKTYSFKFKSQRGHVPRPYSVCKAMGLV